MTQGKGVGSGVTVKDRIGMMFVHWYFIRFHGRDPFGRAYLDLKSYLFARGIVSNEFRSTAKRKMPRWLFTGAPKHTHKAVDDAVEQGVIFVNAVKGIPVFRGIVTAEEVSG